MPDTTVVTETTQTEQTPATVSPVVDPTPTTPVQGNPAADEARRLLYEKHYGAPPPEDRTDPTPTPEVAQTPATSAPAPTPGALPPQYLEVLQALQAELASNRSELAALKNMVRPADQLRPTGDTYEPEPTWVSLMREGRVKEAEDALATQIAAKVQAPAVEQAVARSREIGRAEAEIESFVREVKAANPDLVDAGMEAFVTADAQARLARVQAEGKVKSTDDAVREYKKAVIDATESARNIALRLRGQGATNAMVRSREVLTATTLNPQGVQQDRSATPAPQEPETAQSYFEKRKAAEAARRGLSQ